MTTKIVHITRDTAILLGVSLFLAFAYNALSSKRLSWIRVESNRIMASDSLINTLATAPQTSMNGPDVVKAIPTTTPASVEKKTSTSEQQERETQTKLAQNRTTTAQATTSPITKQPSNEATKQSTASAQDSKVSSTQITNQSTPQSSNKPLEIRIDQVEKLLTNPDVLFIDARKANEYERGHIGNAINIFTPEFEQNIPKVIGLPREKPIVVYCGGGACELSHELAGHLVGLGFTRIFVYTGGWNEWEKRKG